MGRKPETEAKKAKAPVEHPKDQAPVEPEATKTDAMLTDKQRADLYKIARAAGRNDEQWKEFVNLLGYVSSKDIPASEYSRIAGEAAKPHKAVA
jgi:alkylhydroperoxidase family enzyme